MTYAERIEQRKEYYAEKGRKLQEEGEKLSNSGWKRLDAIPFGQPLLVGHHSYSADKHYREKACNSIDKGYELQNKAEYYSEKAKSYGTHGISSQDEEARDKISAKIKDLKAIQNLMKSANKAIRLKNIEKGNAELQSLGFSESEAEKLRKPDFCGRIGYPSYALTNNNANIRRLEARLIELDNLEKVKAEQETTGTECTDLYTYKIEDNRHQFIFDGKPADEVRTILKSNGFKWSPSRCAWVRLVTANSLYSTKRVKALLCELPKA